jgi:hypothetical protein
MITMFNIHDKNAIMHYLVQFKHEQIKTMYLPRVFVYLAHFASGIFFLKRFESLVYFWSLQKVSMIKVSIDNMYHLFQLLFSGNKFSWFIVNWYFAWKSQYYLAYILLLYNNLFHIYRYHLQVTSMCISTAIILTL